jgi:hypothetical protein
MLLTLVCSRVSCQKQPVLYQAIFDVAVVVVVVVRSFFRIVVPVNRNILTLVCIGDLLLLLPGKNLFPLISFSLLSRSPASSFLSSSPHVMKQTFKHITIDLLDLNHSDHTPWAVPFNPSLRQRTTLSIV